MSSYIINGKRKLYYSFGHSSSQMIEEYDIQTHRLLSRVWKKQSKLSAFVTPEIGQIDQISKPSDAIQLSSSNVVRALGLTEAHFVPGRLPLALRI